MSRTRALSVRPLTDAERQALQDSLRSPDAFLVRRARIVLASAAGERSGQIALRLGCTMQGVRAVIHAFNARGLDVLRPGSYHPGVVGGALEGPRAHPLCDLLHQSPRTFGKDTRAWTLKVAADVAGEQGVTAQHGGGVTMRTTSARMGVRSPRAKEWIISPNPEYARKKAWCDRLIRLAQWHPHWLLGFEDEVWPRRLAHPALHAGQDNDHALRLIEQTVARDDSAPEAQSQHVRFTHVRRYASPRPSLRLRRMTTAAVVAAVVLLLFVLAAVTAHVLTTPAHKLAVLPSISSQLTVPSPTSVPAIGWLSVIAVVVLLILLVEKQRVAGASGGREKKLSRALNIAILPLLAALAVTVLVEVAASVSQGS